MQASTQKEIDIILKHVDRIARRDGARMLCIVFEEFPNIPIAVNLELNQDYANQLKQAIVEVIIKLRKKKFGDNEKHILLPR